MRKCPRKPLFTADHGWTHCSLFLELLVTLGQLDGTRSAPLELTTSKCTWRDSQSGRTVLSPFVALERFSAMAVRWWDGDRASFVFSEAEVPQLWPFGMLVGILETAPLLRTRSFLGRKVKRASRSWSGFMLPSCLLCQPQLSGTC